MAAPNPTPREYWRERNDWQVAVASTKGLPDAAPRVALALVRWLNADNECHPSAATIAATIGLSARSAQRALVALEGAGLLSVEHRRGRNGANRLKLAVPQNYVSADVVKKPERLANRVTSDVISERENTTNDDEKYVNCDGNMRHSSVARTSINNRPALAGPYVNKKRSRPDAPGLVPALADLPPHLRRAVNAHEAELDALVRARRLTPAEADERRRDRDLKISKSMEVHYVG